MDRRARYSHRHQSWEWWWRSSTEWHRYKRSFHCENFLFSLVLGSNGSKTKQRMAETFHLEAFDAEYLPTVADIEYPLPTAFKSLPRVKFPGKVKVLVVQSCLTLCDPMDSSLPVSSVHGLLKARILEWAATPFSRESSWPRGQTRVSCTAGRFFTNWVTREARHMLKCQYSHMNTCDHISLPGSKFSFLLK